MKVCKVCNQSKDDCEFSKHAINPDGLNIRCRLCDRMYRKALEEFRVLNPLPPKQPKHIPEPGFKTCTKCKQDKQLSDFYACKRAKDGLEYSCKDCKRIKSERYMSDPAKKENIRNKRKIWQKKHQNKRNAQARERNKKQENKDKIRNKYLLRNYNMNTEKYEELFIKQARSCAMCGLCLPDGSTKLNVDHDHITGAVRGLLCQVCNSGLGSFHDSVDYLYRVVGYYVNPPAQRANINKWIMNGS